MNVINHIENGEKVVNKLRGFSFREEMCKRLLIAILYICSWSGKENI